MNFGKWAVRMEAERRSAYENALPPGVFGPGDIARYHRRFGSEEAYQTSDGFYWHDGMDGHRPVRAQRNALDTMFASAERASARSPAPPPPPPPPAAKKEDQECVVCMDAPACVQTQPCNHVVACLACLGKLRGTPNERTCLVCRQPVTRLVVDLV